MYEHLKFTWNVFWRWLIVSFIPNFIGELISTGLMHKGWIQIPVAFLTLWLALIWFLKTESTSGRNHDATLNSPPHAGPLTSFVFRFTWDIFWRWYLVEFIVQAACSLVFPKSSIAMTLVQQIAPFPALIAALFWVRKAALNFDAPNTSP